MAHQHDYKHATTYNNASIYKCVKCGATVTYDPKTAQKVDVNTVFDKQAGHSSYEKMVEARKESKKTSFHTKPVGSDDVFRGPKETAERDKKQGGLFDPDNDPKYKKQGGQSDPYGDPKFGKKPAPYGTLGLARNRAAPMSVRNAGATFMLEAIAVLASAKAAAKG